MFNHALKIMLSLLIVSLLAFVSPVSANMSIEQQREIFTKAERALKKGHYRTYKRLKKQLGNYPLKPYLEFQYIRKRISRTPEDKIKAFIEENRSSPLSGRLHYSWLRNLAKKKKWKKFLDEYKPTRNTKLRCHRAQALYETNQLEEADELAKSLWLVGKSQLRLCDPAFKAWTKRGKLNDELRWERIGLAMNKGNVSLAKFIAKPMSKSDRDWVKRWGDMRRRPAENLLRKVYQVDRAIPNKIVRYGVKRLARRDADAAHDYWETVRDRHVKTAKDDVYKLDQYIALQGSYQKHPSALEWLSEIEDPNEKVRTWRIRVALGQQDWWSALTWIEALPSEERNSELWRYWRGRILELQSESLPVLATAAERIFASLSDSRSYHGFLSAEKIGADVNLKSDSLIFSDAQLKSVEQIPGITRARELFLLRKKVDARREWHFITKQFDANQLKKASVLANKWGWHDRAIATVAKASHYGDLKVRFPVAYKDIILDQAEDNNIDPAWVYGIMRQESIFMSDARSGAGALGLMQIMPRTGRFTARAKKIRIRSNKDLLNVNKNIRLGAAYLRHMLDENNGNSVLATASYNAGPYRVKQWLPNKNMPSDIWVETIPYNETRNYVRRVMSYTLIYDHKLDGKIRSIRSRMPEIKSRSSVDS